MWSNPIDIDCDKAKRHWMTNPRTINGEILDALKDKSQRLWVTNPKTVSDKYGDVAASVRVWPQPNSRGSWQTTASQPRTHLDKSPLLSWIILDWLDDSRCRWGGAQANIWSYNWVCPMNSVSHTLRFKSLVQCINVHYSKHKDWKASNCKGHSDI